MKESRWAGYFGVGHTTGMETYVIRGVDLKEESEEVSLFGSSGTGCNGGDPSTGTDRDPPPSPYGVDLVHGPLSPQSTHSRRRICYSWIISGVELVVPSSGRDQWKTEVSGLSSDLYHSSTSHVETTSLFVVYYTIRNGVRWIE